MKINPRTGAMMGTATGAVIALIIIVIAVTQTRSVSE